MNETGYYNKMYSKVKIPEILKFCFEKQISPRSTQFMEMLENSQHTVYS